MMAADPLPFHPEMVPSSVSKMNRLVVPPTLKPPRPLATVPVGVAGFELPPGGGIVKVPWRAPFLSYRVDVPLLLLAIQNGLPGKYEMPQGLMRLESVCAAMPAVSETKLVCL